MIVSGSNSYYINWHIIGFRQFKCRCGIRTNMFSFEHVLYLNFSWALSWSMFYIKTNYIRIMNMYFSWFNRLGFTSYYKFHRFNCNGWHNWYLFFPIMTCFRMSFIKHAEKAIWLSPIVVVPKKNRKQKICVDFKKLNTTTKKDPYPLPFTDEVINTIVGHEIYTFLNGFFGYHHISIALEH